MKIMVTGAAGFIGSAVCRNLAARGGIGIVALDKMTYAASPATLQGLVRSGAVHLETVDICDAPAVRRVA